MDLSNVPLEVLELILSHLTDPVSQRRLAQVRTITRSKVSQLLQILDWQPACETALLGKTLLIKRRRPLFW